MLKKISIVVVLFAVIFSCCYFICRDGETVVVDKAKKVILDADGSWKLGINNKSENAFFWRLSSQGGIEITGQFIDDGDSNLSITYPSGKCILIDKDGNIHEFDFTQARKLTDSQENIEAQKGANGEGE